MKLYELIGQIDSDYVIHCKTEDEAVLLIQCLDKLGRAWCTGEVYLDTKWDTYQDKTVYYINEGMFGNIEMLSIDEYTPIEFSEVVSHFATETNKNSQLKKQLGELIINHMYNEFKDIGIYEEVEDILCEFSDLVDSWEVF